LRNKGGDDDDDDDDGCVRNGGRLHHGERLGGEEIRERREDKIGCEKKMWDDRGSINMGPAKLMPVWVGLPWVCIEGSAINDSESVSVADMMQDSLHSV
jgi:hypothetical protein